MAKFCSQCGKQLADGEVCNCTSQEQVAQSEFVQSQEQGQSVQGQQSQGQSAQPQLNQFIDSQQINKEQLANDTKIIVADFVELLKHPIGKLTELSQKKRGMVMGAVLAGVQVFISTLIAIVLMILLRVGIGNASAFLPSLPYVQFPLMVLIFTMGSVALTALFLYVFDCKVFKGNATFGSMLTVVGAKALVSVACLLVGTVLSILSPGIGMTIIMVGIFVSLAYMALGYSAVSVLDSDKKALVIMIVTAIMTVVDFIFVRIVISTVVASFVSYIGSIGSILSIFS